MKNIPVRSSHEEGFEKRWLLFGGFEFIKMERSGDEKTEVFINRVRF